MIKLYVDGGTRYGGICLHDPQKNKTICKKRNGVQYSELTNNELEYLAVIYALEYSKNHYEGKELTIYSDSQLIVNHISGKYKCNPDNLKRLLERTKNKMRDEVIVKWIPREKNLAGHHLEKFY